MMTITNQKDLSSSAKVKGQAVERIDNGCMTHQWHSVSFSANGFNALFKLQQSTNRINLAKAQSC
jgi:hypothetical protein